MLTVTLCVIADCDACGAQPAFNPGHFSTESIALAKLVALGWWATPQAELFCPACAARRVCAVRGHLWTPWRACKCTPVPGAAAGRPLRCGDELRWCARCDHGETRGPGQAVRAVA